MPLDNINTIQISDRDATDLDRTNSKDNLYNSKYDDIVNKHKESYPMSQPATKYVINKPYENKLQELIYDNGSMLRDAIDEAIERNQRIKENDDRILERISNSQDNKSKTNQIKDANKAYHNKPKYVLKNPYENNTQKIIYDKNILSNTINTAINKEWQKKEMSKTDDMFERSRKKEQQKRDFDTRQFLDSIGKMNTYGTVNPTQHQIDSAQKAYDKYWSEVMDLRDSIELQQSKNTSHSDDLDTYHSFINSVSPQNEKPEVRIIPEGISQDSALSYIRKNYPNSFDLDQKVDEINKEADVKNKWKQAELAFNSAMLGTSVAAEGLFAKQAIQKFANVPKIQLSKNSTQPIINNAQKQIRKARLKTKNYLDSKGIPYSTRAQYNTYKSRQPLELAGFAGNVMQMGPANNGDNSDFNTNAIQVSVDVMKNPARIILPKSVPALDFLTGGLGNALDIKQYVSDIKTTASGFLGDGEYHSSVDDWRRKKIYEAIDDWKNNRQQKQKQTIDDETFDDIMEDLGFSDLSY